MNVTHISGRHSSDTSAAVAAGALAALVSFVGCWIPQFWYDEMATLGAARRTPAQLMRLLGNVDAVHGAYYWFMDGWLRLVPDTELWTRLPGVVAIGLAGAGIHVLARRLTGPTTALVAAVFFAFLPSTVQTATEARPYAFTVAAAVWATLALVTLVRAILDGRRWWPAALTYGVLLVTSMAFSILSAPLMAAHALSVLISRSTRRAIPIVLACMVAAVIVVSPLVLAVADQSGQVAWIGGYHYNPVLRVNDIAFPNAPQLTLLALVVGVCTLVGIVRARADRGSVATQPPPPGLTLPVIAWPWLIVPPILLGLYSLISPSFVTRYLWFVAPAVALLLAAGVIRLADNRIRAGVPMVAVWTAAFVVLALPTVVYLHTPLTKPYGIDYRSATKYLAEHVAAEDCLVEGDVAHADGTSRYIAEGYPQGFARGRDIMLDDTAGSSLDRGALWDRSLPMDTTGQRARGCPRVWVLTDRENASVPSDSLRANGFRESGRFTGKDLQVIAFVPTR